MKLNMNGAMLQKSEVLATQKYDIGNVPLIIDFLRNKIYSNKIRVICQEYMCNARDAHREVNKENVPIVISCPTELEPTLHVRDYGLGITPERMSDVFCFFGKTTKGETDNETGGFGLGAKSAWSYVDQYNVITFVDGVKRYYTMGIDETQCGEMNLIHEEPTSEENGTLVSIPIKANDLNSFCEWVVYSCAHWKNKPTIERLPKEVQWIDENNVKYSGDNWKLFYIYSRYDPQSASSIDVKYGVPGSECNRKVSAIVDGIYYPLNFSVLLQKYDNDSTLNKKSDVSIQYFCNNFHCLLYFKTGEVDVNINRESLEYNEKTKKALLEKIISVANIIANNVLDRINNQKDIWYAMGECKYLEDAEINLLNKTKIMWKNVEIKFNTIDLNDVDSNISAFDVTKKYNSGYDFKLKNITSIYPSLNNYSEFSTNKKIEKKFKKIVINDLKYFKRPKACLLSTVLEKHNNFYLLSPNYGISFNEARLLPKKEQDEIIKNSNEEFEKELKLLKIDKMDPIYLSTIPEPPKVKKDAIVRGKREKRIVEKSKINVGIIERCQGNTTNINNRNKEVSVDEISGFYLHSEGVRICVFENKKLLSEHSFDLSMRGIFDLMGEKLKQIYTIPKRFVYKFKNNKNLHLLDDAILKTIEDATKKKDSENIIRKACLFRKTVEQKGYNDAHEDEKSFLEMVHYLVKLKFKHKIKNKNSQFINYLDSFYLHEKYVPNLLELIKEKITYNYDKDFKQVEEIQKKYPLIKHLKTWNVDSNFADEVADYINAVDNNKK